MACSFIEENVPLNTEEHIPPYKEVEEVPSSVPKLILLQLLPPQMSLALLVPLVVFLLQINIFLKEKVEKKVSIHAVEFTLPEDQLNAKREEDEIPREEVVSLLVQREVDKFAKSLESILNAVMSLKLITVLLKLLLQSTRFHYLVEKLKSGKISILSIVDHPKGKEKNLLSRKCFMYSLPMLDQKAYMLY
eukprot:Gb_18265 [translate_table: standard]